MRTHVLIVAALALSLAACGSVRTHRVADSTRGYVLHLAPAADGRLPEGYHYAEYFRLRHGTLVAIRANTLPAEEDYRVVTHPDEDIFFRNQDGPPAYLPAGVMIGDADDAEMATHGVLSPSDCDYRELFPVGVEPGWVVPDMGIQGQKYRLLGNFADVRLRRAGNVAAEQGVSSIEVTHNLAFDEAVHRSWTTRALNWFTTLPKETLCGIALMQDGMPVAYDIFSNPVALSGDDRAALSLLHGYVASDVFGDFAPGDRDYLVSMLEGYTLMSFWENCPLDDVIDGLRSQRLHVARSHGIDGDSESSSPQSSQTLAEKLAWLETEQDAVWMMNGGVMTLVPADFPDELWMSQDIYQPEYFFDFVGASPEAAQQLASGLSEFFTQAEQDIDKAAESHDLLLRKLDELFEFEPLSGSGPLYDLTRANACLIVAKQAHPLLLTEQERRLYAIRAQVLLMRAREELKLYRPNAWTLVTPHGSRDGHKLEVCRDARTGKVIQYTWLGD